MKPLQGPSVSSESAGPDNLQHLLCHYAEASIWRIHGGCFPPHKIWQKVIQSLQTEGQEQSTQNNNQGHALCWQCCHGLPHRTAAAETHGQILTSQLRLWHPQHTPVIIIIITLFMSQVYLAEHRGSTNWGDSKSNQINQHKSNQICWFLVRGENRRTQGETFWSRVENQQTQPTCGSGPGIEPGPHILWKASIFTTAPTLLLKRRYPKHSFQIYLSSPLQLRNLSNKEHNIHHPSLQFQSQLSFWRPQLIILTVNRLAQRVHRYHSSVFSLMQYDWPKKNKSSYATEIVWQLGFADAILGGKKWPPEIRLHSQACV